MKNKKSVCDQIDECSINCCNIWCGYGENICFPFYFFLKYIISPFERPYSFCFIINFFLLITPALLLVILCIQLSQLNESFDNFNFIIGFLLTNLLLNFAVSFYIYYLYGIHKVLKEKEVTFSDIKLYIKYLYNYIIGETFLRWVILYYFCQIVSTIMCFIRVYDQELIKKYQGKIVLDFTIFALYCNAIFLFINIVLYSFLFLLLLCKINVSCICKVISNWFKNEAIEANHSNLKEFLSIDSKFYVNKSFKFYKFVGLYDIEKAFPKKEENVIKIDNE